MKIMKFGGTSVKNNEGINKIVTILSRTNENALIVLSAVAGITNMLEELFLLIEKRKFKEAKLIASEIKFIHINYSKSLNVEIECEEFIEFCYVELINIIDSIMILNEINSRIKDRILSFGELLSAYIVYNCLLKNEFNIKYINAQELIITDSNFGEVVINQFATKLAIESVCKPVFKNTKFIITSGFIGSDTECNPTTLGRGGSDYSAAIFASFLNADKVEIWKEVDGILTADPKFVSRPIIQKELSYNEALEISNLGSKVLQNKTLYPLIKSQIPLAVLNTFDLENEGTLVSYNEGNDKNKPKNISIKNNLLIITITFYENYNISNIELINFLNSIKIDYELVSFSNTGISIILQKNSNYDLIVEKMKDFGSFQLSKNQICFSIIGENINKNLQLQEKIIQFFNKNFISVNFIESNNIKLKYYIDNDSFEEKLDELHNLVFNFE